MNKQIPKLEIEETKKALKNYTKSYKLNIKTDKISEHLKNTRQPIINTMKKELQKMKGFKFIETIKSTFTKTIIKKDEKTGEQIEVEEVKPAYFNSKAKLITNENEIQSQLQLTFSGLENSFGEWLSEGSGWTIGSIDNHFVNIIQYTPLKGNSFIKLSIELQNPNKGLINIQNTDNECFRWCHIRHLNPQQKNPQRIKKIDKEFINNLNYENINFPVTVKDYHKIELQNNMNINVFGYEDKQPYPIFISKEKYENIMNLLLITEDKKSHYVLIKDFNKFMYKQSKHKSKKHFCMHCLQCFSTEIILKNHKLNCLIINGKQAIKMPKKGEQVYFKKFNKQIMAPFVVYADFEAITEKVDSCKQNNNKSYTENYQKHTACSYGYKLVCCYDDKYSKPVAIYRGENAIYKFMEKMLEEVIYCQKIKKKHFNQNMFLTKEDKEDFKTADKCHICSQKYTEKDIRVRDHCHITGKYRGSAHQKCNRNFRLTDKIPIFFHNLKGYDCHFIMQEIGKFNMDINVIACNMEKYMAFMLGKNLVFLDSFQFMSSSLENLVKNLPEKEFKYTTEEFKENTKLLARKGIYPYDYMDKFDKFNDKQLPQKAEFYSLLNDEHITDDDYKYAKEIWQKFNLENMGKYHDLYLKTDVLLLADVFESFRKTCMEYYKLDHVNILVRPGFIMGCNDEND